MVKRPGCGLNQPSHLAKELKKGKSYSLLLCDFTAGYIVTFATVLVVFIVSSPKSYYVLKSAACRRRVKLKVTLVQALRLCTGRTVHRGSRGIALLFHNHSTRRAEGSASRPGRSLPRGKDPVPIVQEAGWAPGLVWTGAENLDPTGIRSPDRSARSSVTIPPELPGPFFV